MSKKQKLSEIAINKLAESIAKDLALKLPAVQVITQLARPTVIRDENGVFQCNWNYDLWIMFSTAVVQVDDKVMNCLHVKFESEPFYLSWLNLKHADSFDALVKAKALVSDKAKNITQFPACVVITLKEIEDYHA